MFEPKGEYSYAEIIYRAIRDRPTGVLIPYHELPLGLKVVQGERTKVSKRFETEQNRHVVCVTGQGWKIVSGMAQMDSAVRQRRRGIRNLGRSAQIAGTIDRRELSAEEQLRVDQELVTSQTAYGMLRSLMARPKPGLDEVKAWREKKSA